MIFQYYYELFEYIMIFFDLYNDLEMFQHYMNDIFRDFLDEFLIIYLNNLLIYSKTGIITRQGMNSALNMLATFDADLKGAKVDLSRTFDDRFIRMWELYLAYCEAAFLERHAGDFQLVLTKNNSARVLFNEPWMTADAGEAVA